MERRKFLKMVGGAGSAAALGCNGSALAASSAAPTENALGSSTEVVDSESRHAFKEFIGLLNDIDREFRRRAEKRHPCRRCR